jgi:hypothetical protein
MREQLRCLEALKAKVPFIELKELGYGHYRNEYRCYGGDEFANVINDTKDRLDKREKDLDAQAIELLGLLKLEKEKGTYYDEAERQFKSIAPEIKNKGLFERLLRWWRK